jgi:Na+-driven multidrug efflux pump
MTAHDHNKTLCLVYSFLSIIFILLLVASPFIINNNFGDPHSTDSGKVLVILSICGVILVIKILLLSTAYGLLKRKRWTRIPAFIMAALFVWSFPLGTALAVYTWWFMHSEGGKQLYLKP